jgi:hypothetical protein
LTRFSAPFGEFAGGGLQKIDQRLKVLKREFVPVQLEMEKAFPH